MQPEELFFTRIVETMAARHPHVAPGRMMSSPGLRYKNKVFAFYHDGHMVFRLGRAFQPESMGLKNWTLLNPFKNKAPLADWFQVPFSEQEKWQALSEKALAAMQIKLEASKGK